MTQRNPDPASLPEAIPVLSYERQTDDGAMEWVLRFVGAWVICAGAAYTLYYATQVGLFHLTELFSRYGTQLLCMDALLLCSVASIVCGVGIARRFRHGFHGSLILVAVGPMLQLVFDMSAGAGRGVLFLLPSRILPTAAVFAALLSILRRADARGAIRPRQANRMTFPQEGNNLGFLLSRTGWVLLAQSGVFIAELAVGLLLTRAKLSTVLWHWQFGAQVALLLTFALGALLMCRQRIWAIGLVAATLPLPIIEGALPNIWQRYLAGFPISGMATHYLPSVLITAVSIIMLCLLARKAARTGM